MPDAPHSDLPPMGSILDLEDQLRLTARCCKKTDYALEAVDRALSSIDEGSVFGLSKAVEDLDKVLGRNDRDKVRHLLGLIADMADRRKAYRNGGGTP